MRETTHFQKIHPGAGVRVVSDATGQSLSARPSGGYNHPWKVSPRWDGTQWVATVKAGLVNGLAPSIRMSGQTLQQGAVPGISKDKFGLNPLTGKPFFSASVFNKGAAPAPADQLFDVPIYLGPTIALPWRAIGFDGDHNFDGDAVPAFFLNLGAANTPNVDAALGNVDAGASALVSALTPPDGLRLLRVVDLWLHQPRLGLTSTVTIFGDAIVTGLQNYTQTLSVATPAPNDSLHIESGDFATASQPALSGGIDVVADDFTETTFDLLLLARVYALSPPRTGLESDPDVTWSVYVSHVQFWNLHYVATPFIGTPQTDPGAAIGNPLVSILAGPIVNGFTSTLAQASERVRNELTARSLAGYFYTPTGDGSTSTLPPKPQPPPAGVSGADKTGRIQAQRRAAALARNAIRLELPFPYATTPFPPAIFSFGLPSNPA